MKKDLARYLRDKLGITQLKLETEEHLRFMNAYLQVMLPEQVQLSADVLAYSHREIQQRYGIEDFNAVIHKNDLMFQHHLRKLPVMSLRPFFTISMSGLDALSKIKALHPGELRQVLDFGAGYGRGSRFLKCFFEKADCSVSEIKPQALQFQASQFGHKTIAHQAEPASFEGDQYDLIMAVSGFQSSPHGNDATGMAG
ncbi:MAG: class I SAM-dependent methyltransferase [Owenweeksia sp.]|nr:class I SAM-dependent methyltransferase [Owenweeksia sp.]